MPTSSSRPIFTPASRPTSAASWLVFDPTRLSSLNGLVRIATGRDAADAAVASIFGRARGTKMEVDCQVAKGPEVRAAHAASRLAARACRSNWIVQRNA